MITATHATVRSLTMKAGRVGHKLYMDFFSPDLFNDLHIRGINCYGIVRQSCKGMLEDFDNKTLKLKWCNICARIRSKPTAMIWKDKWDVYIMTNMHRPPEKATFVMNMGKL
jgi:hypothetical protein